MATVPMLTKTKYWFVKYEVQIAISQAGERMFFEGVLEIFLKWNYLESPKCQLWAIAIFHSDLVN